MELPSDPVEESAIEEKRRLRRTMRDLVALSTLPAVWVGLGVEGIARSLADVLLNTLSLDLIYIRLAGLKGEGGEGVVEIARSKHCPDATVEGVRAAFAPVIEEERGDPPAVILDPAGDGMLHVAVTRFGIGDDHGFLVAGSRNADFPTEQDRSLLGVGANQTAIVVQRRQAEQRLHEQQEWLQVTLASIGDAVITTDTGGRITFLNPVAEELTGWSSADAQGQPLETVFAILHEHTRQPVESPVEKVLREGAVVGLGNDTILLAKDGTERPIDDSAAPIRDAAGKMLGVVLIFREVTQQRREEQLRNARLAVTQVLTQATTVSEAAVGVLQGIGESLSWDVGFFWAVDEARNVLVCHDSWHRPDLPVIDFKNDSGSRSFERGAGFPGRVWSSGEPAWIRDVLQDHDFPRVANAAKYGLQSALACPVIVGNQTLGVIEFFTRRYREPDPGLLEMLATVSAHVGQFIERKLTEDQLRRSNEELVDFFENATVGLHWVGPDGVILRANQAELDMLGYNREEYVGRSIVDFHEDEEVINDILKRLHAGEKLSDYPARMRCKDGSLIDVLIDSSVLWKDGQFIHTRCFTRDVTERKRAEAELVRLTAASEQQRRIYETALSNTADFNYVFDLQGRFLYVNKALLALWGKELNEVVAKNFFELDYPPALAERLHQQIQTVIDTQQALRDETPYTSARGERQYEYIFMPVLAADGSVEAVAGSTRDITERKQIERDLQDARSRLHAALEAGAVVTWTWDIPNNRLFTDKNLAQLFNVDPSDAEGGLLEKYIQAIHPDDSPKVSAALSRSVESGEDYEADYRIMQPDGSARWVVARGRAERDETGRPVRMPGVLVDITERKRLEEELRIRVEQLAEADRRKDEFLATLAHELRNPLAPIRTGLEVMKLAKDDPATMEEIRNTMERQTQQLITLVDDLLDVSRITQGKLDLRKCRVKLSDVVQSAVEASEPLIDEANHELAITVPEPPIYLDADPHRLAQVVSNLLNNAAKYTPEGGHIWLTAERHGSDVVILVKDTGIGIPPDMLESIFEMFSQIDRPMEKGYTGLGIGLTLVKSLVQMHGGRIEVRSEGPNRGSEFRIRLPILVEIPLPQQQPGRADENAAVSNKRRVLVVDDNEAAAKTLSMVVKMLGNDVRTAGDGQEGIEVAAEFLPDIVLMDIGMPRMNGYEAAHHIRQQPWGEDIMLIALTGWGQDEDKRRTKEAGFNYHLAKPAEPSELQQLFAELDRKTTP